MNVLGYLYLLGYLGHFICIITSMSIASVISFSQGMSSRDFYVPLVVINGVTLGN